MLIHFLFIQLVIGYQYPVVLVHGIDSSYLELEEVSKYLRDRNYEVYNLRIGNGYKDSVFLSMPEQLNLMKAEIDMIPELENGFNIIGMSQGGLLARGFVEIYENRVNNLITWVTPHGGQYYNNFNWMYNSEIQSSLSFSNYWRNPTKLEYPIYLENCIYLPLINNEKYINTSYSNNLLKLSNFVMIWSPNDDVLQPPESGKFSTYDENLNVIDLPHNIFYTSLSLNRVNVSIFETTCNHKDHRNVECFDYFEKYTIPFLT